jgi:hypothetical protein
MQNTYFWKVKPSAQPTVIKNCSKCGTRSEFESSGNFRINANQNHLDVWLIYQCKKCNTTWNMEILSRVHPGDIKEDLYLKFQRNDPELARRYSFDSVTHSRNRSVMNFEGISYEVEGEGISLQELKEDVTIEISCEYPLDIRLDKILSGQLGISREMFKKMVRTGHIFSEDLKDIAKAKIRDGIKIIIRK